MAVSDASGTVLAANPAYFELYGYAPEKVLGRHFALIFPSEQRATAQAQYEEVFNSPNPPEGPRSIVRNKAGAERVVQARVVFVDVPGERKAMLSIIRDERRAYVLHPTARYGRIESRLHKRTYR